MNQLRNYKRGGTIMHCPTSCPKSVKDFAMGSEGLMCPVAMGKQKAKRSDVIAGRLSATKVLDGLELGVSLGSKCIMQRSRSSPMVIAHGRESPSVNGTCGSLVVFSICFFLLSTG